MELTKEQNIQDCLYKYLYATRGFTYTWDEKRNGSLTGWFMTDSYAVEAVFKEGENLTLTNTGTNKVLFSGPVSSIEEFESILETHLPKIEMYEINFSKRYASLNREGAVLQFLKDLKDMSPLDILDLVEEADEEEVDEED